MTCMQDSHVKKQWSLVCSMYLNAVCICKVQELKSMLYESCSTLDNK